MIIIPYKTNAPIYYLPYATVGMIAANILVYVLVGQAPEPRVYPAEWVSDEHKQVRIETAYLEQFDMAQLGFETPVEIEAVTRVIDRDDPNYMLYEHEGQLYALEIDREGGLLNQYNWMLQHGRGLHPTEWLLCNFSHAGLMHLFGNMVFLWTFGLVVEGKVGWWRFVVICLTIGVVQAALVQIVMLWSLGGFSLGASSIIYGLIAIAYFWAPENEMSVFCWFFTLVTMFDISIVSLAGIYVLIEVAMFMIAGFGMSTAMLHLSGALVGAVVGIAMIKLDWVDCEGWDYFSVSAGRHIKTASERSAEVDTDTAKYEEEVSERKAAIEAHIRRLIEEGKVDDAHRLYVNSFQKFGQWELPQQTLMALIAALDREKRYDAVLPLMVGYVRRFPNAPPLVRLKLAQLLLEHERRPVKALQILDTINAASLDEKKQKILAQMRDKAKQLADDEDSELELSDNE